MIAEARINQGRTLMSNEVRAIVAGLVAAGCAASGDPVEDSGARAGDRDRPSTTTDASEARDAGPCDEECGGVEGCRAIRGQRAKVDAGCLEPGVVCAVLVPEPDAVISAESPGGECWEFPSGTPLGWANRSLEQCGEGYEACE